jgi:hypothetical protein
MSVESGPEQSIYQGVFCRETFIHEPRSNASFSPSSEYISRFLSTDRIQNHVKNSLTFLICPRRSKM